MADIIGQASILITAEGKDFPKSLEKLGGVLNKAATKAGDQAGTALTKGVQQAASQQVGKAAAKAGQALQKGVVPAAEKAAQKAQSAFGRGMSKIVAIANKSSQQSADAIKKKFVTGATAAANKVSSAVSKIVPSGLQKAANKAGELFKSGMSKAFSAASAFAASKFGGPVVAGMAKIAQSTATAFNKVGSLIVTGMSKAATAATAAFQKGFKIAAAGLREATQAVGRAGGKLLTGMVSAARSAGSAAGKVLGTSLKATAVGAVGAVAALAGKTLTGGFGRLVSIDTATKKLEGLGITGKKLDTTMTNAKNAVLGTAFGLDQASTVAASFVAAGIEPGSKLELGLKNVAAAASIAGVGMADIAPIFTDAAASGKITGDTLMRLEMQGIGAAKMMANNLGISTDQLRKKVSKGQVSFEEFSKVIGTELGDAAKIAGTSFKGMMANIGAAMNRVGAVALTPVFEGMKSVMPSVIALFDRLKEAIQPIVDKLAPKVKKFFEGLKKVLDGIEFGKMDPGEAADKLAKFTNTIQTKILEFIGKLPELFLTLLPKIVGAILSKVEFLFTAVAEIMAGIATVLIAGMPQILEAVQTLIPAMVGIFMKLLPRLLDSMSMVINHLVDLAITLAPVLLEGALQLFNGFIQALVLIVPVLIDGFNRMLLVLVGALVQNLPLMIEGAMTLFEGLIDALLQIAPALLEAAITLITALIGALVDNAPALLEGVMALLQGLIQGLVDILPQLLIGIVQLVTGIATALIQNLPLLLQAAITLFLGLVQALTIALPILIEELVEMMPVIIEALTTMIPMLLDAAVSLFSMLVQAVTDNLPFILAALAELLPEIIDAVVGMIPDLIDAAVELFKTLIDALPIILPQLIDGIFAMIPGIVNSLHQMIPVLIDAAVQLFTALIEALPIIIPLLLEEIVDLGPLIFATLKDMVPEMIQGGKDIINGLISGIGSMASSLIKSIKETVTDSLPSFVKKALGIASPSKVFKGFGQNILLGLTSGLSAGAKRAETAMNRIIAKIQDAKGLKGKGALVAYVESQGKALLKAYAAQKTLVDKIKDQQSVLAEMKQVRDDMVKDIAGGLKKEFDLSSFVTTNKATGAKTADFAKMSTGLGAIVARVKKFAGKIQELLGKGYPNAIVQEVAALGSIEGMAVADALLGATATQRGDFISNLKALDTVSSTAGKTLANDLYGVGIAAQQGLVDGLLADKKNLDKAAKDLAKTLTAYVKKHLGIKSPSKVFEGIGEFMGLGLVKGLEAMSVPVSKAVQGMTGVTVAGTTATGVGGVSIPSMPPAAVPAVAAAASGGTTINISLSVPMDDLAQLQTLEDFMAMLRVRSRMSVGSADGGEI